MLSGRRLRCQGALAAATGLPGVLDALRKRRHYVQLKVASWVKRFACGMQGNPNIDFGVALAATWFATGDCYEIASCFFFRCRDRRWFRLARRLPDRALGNGAVGVGYLAAQYQQELFYAAAVCLGASALTMVRQQRARSRVAGAACANPILGWGSGIALVLAIGLLVLTFWIDPPI